MPGLQWHFYKMGNPVKPEVFLLLILHGCVLSAQTLTFQRPLGTEFNVYIILCSLFVFAILYLLHSLGVLRYWWLTLNQSWVWCKNCVTLCFLSVRTRLAVILRGIRYFLFFTLVRQCLLCFWYRPALLLATIRAYCPRRQDVVFVFMYAPYGVYLASLHTFGEFYHRIVSVFLTNWWQGLVDRYRQLGVEPQLEDSTVLLTQCNLPIQIVVAYYNSVVGYRKYAMINGLEEEAFCEKDTPKVGGDLIVFPKLYSRTWFDYEIEFSGNLLIFNGKNDQFRLVNPLINYNYKVVWSDDHFLFLEKDSSLVGSTSKDILSCLTGNCFKIVNINYTWSVYSFGLIARFMLALLKLRVTQHIARVVVLGDNILVYKIVGGDMVSMLRAHSRSLSALITDCSAQRFLSCDFGKISTLAKRHIVQYVGVDQSLVLPWVHGTIYLTFLFSLLLNRSLFLLLGDLKSMALANNLFFEDWMRAEIANSWSFTTKHVFVFCFMFSCICFSICFYMQCTILHCILTCLFLTTVMFCFLMILMIKRGDNLFLSGRPIATIRESCMPCAPKAVREGCELDRIPGRCDECHDGGFVYAPCKHEHVSISSSCVHNGYSACINRNVGTFNVDACPDDFVRWADHIIDSTLDVQLESIHCIDPKDWARRFDGHKREAYEEAIDDEENEGTPLFSNSFSAFLKREFVLGKKDLITGESDYFPRLIVSSKPGFSAKIGPKVYTASKILKAAWGGGKCDYAKVKAFPNIHYTAGLNKNDLGQLYDDMITMLGADCFLGIFDFSKFDAHLQEKHIQAERKLYEFLFSFLTPSEVKEFFDGLDAQMTRKGIIKCRDGTLFAKLHAARKSGDQNTSVGNSFLNVCFHTYVLNMLGVDVLSLLKQNKMAIWVMGDDCLIWYHKSISAPPIQDYMAAMSKVGMEVKGDYYRPQFADYCSNLFFPSKEGTVATQYLGRNICKAYCCLKKYNNEKARYWVKQVSQAFSIDMTHIPFMHNYHKKIYDSVRDAKHVRLTLDGEYDGKHVARASQPSIPELNQYLYDRYDIDAKEAADLATLSVQQFLESPTIMKMIDVDVYEKGITHKVPYIEASRFFLQGNPAIDITKLPKVVRKHKGLEPFKPAIIADDLKSNDDDGSLDLPQLKGLSRKYRDVLSESNSRPAYFKDKNLKKKDFRSNKNKKYVRRGH